MSQAPSVAFAGVNDRIVDAPADVALRGTTRGLEIWISGTPSAAALRMRLTELLAEAPGFFAGSQARVAIDGLLPVGALACLEEVAAQFELRIVEIGPATTRRGRLDIAGSPRPTTTASAGRSDPRRTKLADGTGPVADETAEPPRREPAASGPTGPESPVAVEANAGSAPAESPSGPVPRTVPGVASDALVSAATALVSAAAAMTSEPVAVASSPRRDGSGPVDTAAKAGSGPVDIAAKAESSSGPVDTAANVGLPSDPVDAAANAGLPVTAAAAPRAASGGATADAAVKAALLHPTTDAATKIIPPRVTADAAGKAASQPRRDTTATTDPGDPGDPGLVMALAAVLAAATPGEARPGDEPVGPRLVIGPVRSGRIVDHLGHVIVIGDVNPGAEVRAEGSIIVLGRLRGVAHAAIGRDTGCIIALSLQPQQLRIARMVARAGDADRPGGGAEIAYATGETIVVERFSGRLPSGLAASM